MSRVVSLGTLSVALIVGLGLSVRVAGWPLVHVEVPMAEPPMPQATSRPLRPRPDTAGDLLVRRDPFRSERRAAATAYDPLRVGLLAPPSVPRPALALVGIVWDRATNSTALLEGLPGADGPRTLRQGEMFRGLRLQTIAPDHVVVVGFDTVWTLRVKEPWK